MFYIHFDNILLHNYMLWSQDSKVNIVFRLWTDVQGSNPGKDNRILKCLNWYWGPHYLLFSVYGGSFPVVQLSGCEVDHSCASSTEVKNEWS